MTQNQHVCAIRGRPEAVGEVISGRAEETIEHYLKQGHHHNGGRAARGQHIMCSICIHSFGALAKVV